MVVVVFLEIRQFSVFVSDPEYPKTVSDPDIHRGSLSLLRYRGVVRAAATSTLLIRQLPVHLLLRRVT